MSKFPSYTFTLKEGFLDIIRLLDKVQIKASSNLLTSDDVKKCLHLRQNLLPCAEAVYIEAYGGFSFQGYPYKSVCSNLILTNDGGTVRRMTAPEERYGKGSRYSIHLLKTNDLLNSVVLPSFFIKNNSSEHYIFSSL